MKKKEFADKKRWFYDWMRYLKKACLAVLACLCIYTVLTLKLGDSNSMLLCRAYAQDFSIETNDIGELGEDFDLSAFDSLSSGAEFTFTAKFWSTRNGKYGYWFTYKQEYEDGTFQSDNFFVKDKTDGDVISSLDDASYEDQIYVRMKAVYDKTENNSKLVTHYVTVTEAEIVENVIDYATVYCSVMDTKEYEAGLDGWSVYYSLCDLDNDGIYELIMQWGSTAEYYNEVWTIDSDGQATYVGYFYMPQTFYVASDYNGIFGVYGHMGYEMVTRITLANGEIEEEAISEGDIGENDYYSNDMPLSSYDITDRTPLSGTAIDVLENYAGLSDTSAEDTANLIETETESMKMEDSSDLLIDASKENTDIDWDSLSDEEWRQVAQEYWYEKKEKAVEWGGTWEWINEDEVTDDLYDGIITFISDYIDYEVYLNDYYGGDEEYARSHFISIYNDIKYIETTYSIDPSGAALYLIDYCDYSTQQIREMTWYNILSLYEECEIEMRTETESTDFEIINADNYTTWFRSNPETGIEVRIEGLNVSTVFASDGQLLCYLWNESEFVSYGIYIFTDDAGNYLNGDTITVVGIYLGNDPNNNYPVFEAEAIGWSN